MSKVLAVGVLVVSLLFALAGRFRTSMCGLVLSAALFCLTGCGSYRVEWEHVSHPMAGPPFGLASDEDALDTINVIGRKDTGRFYVEAGLGYKLADAGFYGPELTFTSRIGVNLWSAR